MKRHGGLALSMMILLASAGAAGAADAPKGPYSQWAHGPGPGPNFFPIAVWVQAPSLASRYRAAGFNLYVGLWQGPTEEHLAQLKQAGMRVICEQNAVGLRHLDDPTIAGWMHGDEPDNAQPLASGQGYGPPVAPAKIVENYQRIRAADPSRPVLLNLGQGVAWDGWHGRGVRTNHPEDYPEYVQGCDIASFDIYPVTSPSPQVAGNLWYVGQGVERLVGWTQGKKIVWDCIECSQVQSEKNKPTPEQVRCEVWMSIIRGSTGLIYFVHEWKPNFDESSLLHNLEMYAAVTLINHRIHELAAVLNGPTVADGVKVQSANADVPIATMVKKQDGAVYVFSVATRAGQTHAKFSVPGLTGRQTVEVLDEARTLQATDGGFEDDFKPWEVHLYRLTTAK